MSQLGFSNGLRIIGEMISFTIFGATEYTIKDDMLSISVDGSGKITYKKKQ